MYNNELHNLRHKPYVYFNSQKDVLYSAVFRLYLNTALFS